MNTMNSSEIPLFPLNTVLFPGMPLHLHIFEPRYKEMVQKCLDEKLEFGILLLHETQLSQVGCTARITQILRQFENGNMDILTEGRRRFRILDVLNRESYLEAAVEYFDDDSEDIPSDLLKKVLDAYQKMIRLQTRGVGAVRGIFDPVHFSFIIASTIDMVLQERQNLLELTSTTARMRKLDTALLETMGKLDKQEKMKRLAEMNGHGKPEPEESESANGQ